MELIRGVKTAPDTAVGESLIKGPDVVWLGVEAVEVELVSGFVGMVVGGSSRFGEAGGAGGGGLVVGGGTGNPESGAPAGVGALGRGARLRTLVQIIIALAIARMRTTIERMTRRRLFMGFVLFVLISNLDLPDRG